MAENVHELAPEHLPAFLPAADGSDWLYTVMVIFMIALLLGMGTLYFALHALPEKMAHRVNSTQLQLIGILALLALFTHNHIFWVIALILAAVRLPDFTTPLESISRSLEEIKDRKL